MGEYSVQLLEARCQTLEQISTSLQAKLKEFTDLGTVEDMTVMKQQIKDLKKDLTAARKIGQKLQKQVTKGE